MKTVTQVVISHNKELLSADELAGKEMFGFFQLTLHTSSYDGEIYFRHAKNPDVMYSVSRANGLGEYRNLSCECRDAKYKFIDSISVNK